MSDDARHERYNIPNADILSEDVWAEDDASTCAGCGADLDGAKWRCPSCGQWLENCSGSCASCPLPRCVGGKRGERANQG